MLNKLNHLFLNSLPILIMVGLIPLIGNDYLLTLSFIFIIGISLTLKKKKHEMTILWTGFFLMIFFEYIFISTGVETFNRVGLFGMPIWLPVLWAYGFIAIKRCTEILNHK